MTELSEAVYQVSVLWMYIFCVEVAEVHFGLDYSMKSVILLKYLPYMRQLYLIFHGRFPSEKAASLFTAKNAEAFARRGLAVTVLVPKRKGVTGETPAAYYGVAGNFQTKYLPTLDLFQSKLFTGRAFWLSTLTFSWSVFNFLRKNSQPEDIIYSNEIQPLFFASLIRGNCFYEMHDFPESKFELFSHALQRMQWVLIHNQWKLAEAKRRFPRVDSQKFLCEPNAVDIQVFDLKISKEEARKKLNLPLQKKIAIYTGHLYGWKGVDTLAQAAAKLDENFLVVFVGGTEKDVSDFKNKYGASPQILIVGHKPHTEMPIWQKAADVLVLPNTAKEAISTHYTSPMKLYEYMASKRPIIASDIPSIREIVDEKSTIFVRPDDAEILAQAIKDTISLPASSVEAFSAEAFSRVALHTWDKRAERIAAFMDHVGRRPLVSLRSWVMLFARYLFSGLLAFATNIGLFFIFKNYFHLWYLTASTTAFIVSVLVSFAAQKFITFRDRTTDGVHRQMVSYVIIAVINVLVNGVLVYFLVDVLYLSAMISQVISAAVIAIYSLVLYRVVIFHHAKIH